MGLRRPCLTWSTKRTGNGNDPVSSRLTKRGQRRENGTFLFALICAANGEPMLHASGFFLAGILRILCYHGEKGKVPGSLFYPVHSGFLPIERM